MARLALLRLGAGRAGIEAISMPINSDFTDELAAGQARAEAGAQTAMDFYERNAGVPIGTTGSSPEPLPLTEPAAVSGVPWDQQ